MNYSIKALSDMAGVQPPHPEVLRRNRSAFPSKDKRKRVSNIWGKRGEFAAANFILP